MELARALHLIDRISSPGFIHHGCDERDELEEGVARLFDSLAARDAADARRHTPAVTDLQAAQEAVDVAQEALTAATRDRDAAVQAAHRNGAPVPQIAAELGVHRQIVYRIIRRAQV